MIKRLCSYPNCMLFAISGSCYCERHKQESLERRKPFENAVRANQEFYTTTEWRKLRKTVLKETPFCINCGSSGSEDNPLTVDHIIPPRGNKLLFFNKDNLQVLCKNCHRYKTAIEIQNRKNKD